jgi:hypothetical protein
MNVTEIESGLWYWTAPHPAWRPGADWPEEVGSVLYAATDAIVLIDPLVPPGDEDEFWAFLDESVDQADLPVSVLLTASWHERSAPLVAKRYDAAIWAHGSHVPFPAGVEVFEPAGSDEGQVAFFLRPHRALVVGEFLMGESGRLRVCPSPALRDTAAFEQSLRSLLDLPIEHVLVSHGDPVLGGGRRKIEDAVQADA